MLRTSMSENSTGINSRIPKLSPMPKSPPAMPTRSASTMNMNMMSVISLPSTLRTPISLRRSLMDIIIVFAMQIADTSIDTAPIAASMP